MASDPMRLTIDAAGHLTLTGHDDWCEPVCAVCGEPIQWVLDAYSMVRHGGGFAAAHAWCAWTPPAFHRWALLAATPKETTVGDEQTYPAGDGGAWGTWVGRIEQLEVEIERLRAENEALRAALAIKDNHDHFDCTAEREVLRLENQRLQALIDAYAVAWHKGGWAGDTPVLMAASDALVAAATKEDDRG